MAVKAELEEPGSAAEFMRGWEIRKAEMEK